MKGMCRCGSCNLAFTESCPDKSRNKLKERLTKAEKENKELWDILFKDPYDILISMRHARKFITSRMIKMNETGVYLWDAIIKELERLKEIKED